jgi:outer membrane protein assembly factor BamB
MVQGNRQCSGQGIGAGGIPTVKWSVPGLSGVNGTSIGPDGTIYVSSFDTPTTYALDGKTGTVKWTFTMDATAVGVPAVGSNGLVYVGSTYHTFYALDAQTGIQKWAHVYVPDGIGGDNDLSYSSAVIGVDGTVYVTFGISQVIIYAFDGNTGTIKWSYQLAGATEFAPAIGQNGTVYVVGCPSGSGTPICVVALDPVTGIVKWQTPTDGVFGYPSSAPAVGPDGTVYMATTWPIGATGNDGGSVYAMDGSTGSVKWQVDGDCPFSNPAVSFAGVVYVVATLTTDYIHFTYAVTSLNGQTGFQNWQTAVPYGIVNFGTTVSIASDGTIYTYGEALNGTTGSVIWTSSYLTVAPSIGIDGTLYVGGFQESLPTPVIALNSINVVSILLKPSSVQGGVTSTGTVTLNAAAPAGGFTVNLSSNNTAATVANSIIVPAGQTTANFTAVTSPVSSQILAGITALPGVNQTATLTINTAAPLSMSVNPSSVTGGATSAASVTLNGPAGPNGLTVSLASSSAVASVPTSFVIPAGKTNGSFEISTTGVNLLTAATITATAGDQSVNGALTIVPAVLSSLALTPTVVTGGSSSSGTVTLSGPAGPAGTVVNLSSNLASASTPGTVTVSAGQQSASFKVTTAGVNSQSVATISATSAGLTETAKLTINPAALASLIASPSSVIGGSSSTGTVTLNGPAGPNGTVVALSTSSSYATIPASMTISPGQTTGTFAIQTSGVGSQVNAAINANLNGIGQTAALTITPATLLSVEVSPSTVIGGNASKGAVTLNGPAGPGGAIISLASSSADVKVSLTVMIPSGQLTAVFPVNTVGVGTQQVVTITGSLNGLSQSATLTLTAISVMSLSLSPATVVAGATSTGTVTLSSPAGTNGVLVSLSSSNAIVGVPSSASIPSGQTTATFRVTTVGVDQQTFATIAANVYGTSQSSTLTVNAATIMSLTLNPTIITGGRTSTGAVALNGQAGPAGVIVSLSSSSQAATVPGQVTIANGQVSGLFTVLTSPLTNAQTVTVLAKAGGGTAYANLSILTATVAAVTLSPSSVSGGLNSTGTVTLTGPAPTGGLTVNLTSSSTVASLQPTLKFSVGQISATFAVKTKAVSTLTSSTITAVFGTVSANATLEIHPPSLVSVTLSPSNLVGGSSTTGTVTLSGPAPGSGVLVKLSSNSSIASVQPSVTVPSGQKTATFRVKTLAVGTQGLADISGNLNGVLESAPLTVNPPILTSLKLSPTTTEGGKTVTGTVTIGSAAPSTGLVISLSSSNSVATPPTSVTIPAGKTSITFKVTTSKVTSKTTATIAGTSNTSSTSAILTVT